MVEETQHSPAKDKVEKVPWRRKLRGLFRSD